MWGSSLRQRLRLAPLYCAIAAADVIARCAPPPRLAAPMSWLPGVSVLIPERDAPGLLQRALESVAAALTGIGEPQQIVVVANGAPATRYDTLRAQFPQVEWVHSDAPLGFSAAVAAGLARVQHAWTYLMNNDVTLEREALQGVLEARAADVFGIASQLLQRSASGRREETGFLDWYADADGLHAFHAQPHGAHVRPHLAASGGAALFRTAILRRYVAASRVYDPFYYEDLEWGVRAWQEGWRVLYCPVSRAHHRHRATTARFYDPATLDSIVARNRRLFEARHDREAGAAALLARVCTLPYECQRALARPRTAAQVFAQRLRTRRAARMYVRPSIAPLLPPRLAGSAPEQRAVELAATAYSYRLRSADPPSLRPRVLVVTPFAVFPPRHGGARRLAGLLEYLREDFDVVLIGDEATLYDARSFAHFDGLFAVHLVQRREPPAHARPRTLEARMRAHIHPALVDAVHDALSHYRPALVQVEHVEIADLVALRKPAQRWVLGLHDAYGATDFADDAAARRFTGETLPAYDAVTVCSEEDAALVAHRRITVVPNGSSVAPDGYAPSNSGPMLFMGPFRYIQNLAGIRRFLGEAYPAIRVRVPQAELLVLGGEGATRLVNGDPLFAQPGVTVMDHREDVVDLLAQSALTINPLEAIRGSPIKVIESLCAGRACVTTAEGARGFGALGLPGLVVARDVADMSEPIVRLLTDAAERHRVERPDPARLAPFQWRVCARRQQALYGELLAGK